MEFRDSFSRLKKKVKHRLTGSKPKPNKTGADIGGESFDPTGSRSESEPHVVAGGSRDQGGKESNKSGSQILSTIRLSRPDDPGPVLARGSINDQGRRGTDVDGGEIEQTHPHLLLTNVEVAEGSGAEGKDIDGEEVERGGPSPFTTSVPHDVKIDSA